MILMRPYTRQTLPIRVAAQTLPLAPNIKSLYLAIQKAFTTYCRELKILKRGPHKARKTYISELLDYGVNINTVRAIAGHKDEHTTFNNYCFDRKTKSERDAQVIAAIQ